MKIPHYRELKQRTDDALSVARDPERTILVYAGIITGMGLLVTVLTQMLSSKISNTGGLSNLDSRSLFSTIQSILPLAQSVILMCLEMGYLSAAMRFARKQYADAAHLKTGFGVFAPLLRMLLLQTLVYVVILLVVTNIVSSVFITSSFGQPLLDAMNSYLESGVAPEDIPIDALLLPMLPLLAVVLALFALVAIPLSYRYRLANYFLLDYPRAGAIAAMRNSWRTMRGNGFRLFKVDLHFWWYYLLSFLASLICYGDQLLPRVGIELPISETAAYFLFYGIYLVIQFFLFWRFRNRLEVTYATAYDTLRPQPAGSGVVLGNIFDLAKNAPPEL